MSSITVPYRISFKDWVGSLITSFPALSIPIPPKKEEDWRRWALSLLLLNPSLFLSYPLRRDYPQDTDWRRWGVYLLQGIQGGI